MKLTNRDVLVVVDMQNDFCEGGALPTADGHEVVPVINKVGQKFANVVLTQDWHPEGHVSFASADKAWREVGAAGVTRITSSDLQ